MAVNIKKAAPASAYAKGKAKLTGSVYEKFLKSGEAPTVDSNTIKVALHTAGPSLQHKEVTGSTSIEKKVSGETVQSGKTQETVLTGIAAQPDYAKVGCSGGRTLQPAPFESVRVDVWLEMPCPNDPDSINQAYDFVTDWVSSKLQEAEAAFKPAPPAPITVAAYPAEAPKEATSGYVKMNAPTATTFMAGTKTTTITKD